MIEQITDLQRRNALMHMLMRVGAKLGNLQGRHAGTTIWSYDGKAYEVTPEQIGIYDHFEYQENLRRRGMAILAI